MSATTKRPFIQALPIAQKITAGIADACKEVIIAGSLRRRQAMIGDIEIVAIPDGDKLYRLLDAKLEAGTIRHVMPRKRWGERQRSFVFADWMVEIWIQPDPATLPVNLMIRTGSALFSKQMVTRKGSGGWMPDWYEIKEARVWHEGSPVEIADERALFALWGIDYVEPRDRRDSYKPHRFLPVRPQRSAPLLDDLPIPEPVMGTRGKAPRATTVPTGAFRFDDPLPLRFSGWDFSVSPDAGTEAARRRRAEEVRLLYDSP